MNKVLLSISLSFVSLFSIAQSNSEEAVLYREAAQGMCDCVNESFMDLSERMRDIVLDAAGDEQKFEEEAYDYATEDPEAAALDFELIEGSVMTSMESCFDRIVNDYEDVYTEDSDEEVEKKLIEALRTLDGCETAVAFFELGIEDQEKEGTAQSTEVRKPSGESSSYDPQYAEVAVEVCNCVGSSASPMSDRMAQVFIDSKGDPEKMEKLIFAYVEEDPENAEKDAELLQGQIPEDIGKCMSRLEAEYDYLFEGKSEDEMFESLFIYWEDMPDCELSKAFIEIGMNLD